MSEKENFKIRLAALMGRQSDGRKTSNQELAEYVGVTRQTISLYRMGRCIASAPHLQKIADYFEVSTDYLLGFTDDPLNKDVGPSGKVAQLLDNYIVNKVAEFFEEEDNWRRLKGCCLVNGRSNELRELLALAIK